MVIGTRISIAKQHNQCYVTWLHGLMMAIPAVPIAVIKWELPTNVRNIAARWGSLTKVTCSLFCNLPHWLCLRELAGKVADGNHVIHRALQLVLLWTGFQVPRSWSHDHKNVVTAGISRTVHKYQLFSTITTLNNHWVSGH